MEHTVKGIILVVQGKGKEGPWKRGIQMYLERCTRIISCVFEIEECKKTHLKRTKLIKTQSIARDEIIQKLWYFGSIRQKAIGKKGPEDNRVE